MSFRIDRVRMALVCGVTVAWGAASAVADDLPVRTLGYTVEARSVLDDPIAARTVPVSHRLTIQPASHHGYYNGCCTTPAVAYETTCCAPTPYATPYATYPVGYGYSPYAYSAYRPYYTYAPSYWTYRPYYSYYGYRPYYAWSGYRPYYMYSAGYWGYRPYSAYRPYYGSYYGGGWGSPYYGMGYRSYSYVGGRGFYFGW